MKFASLFTGMGGADIGAMQAGLTPIWGVEIDDNIAEIACNNFEHHTYTIDVKSLYWQTLNSPDWLHASPPCINASRAKNGKETSEDIELANAICRAIETLKPDYFSLENVAGYASFKSLANIKRCLKNNDYYVGQSLLDCSDYGVPQSRKRLFLVASKHWGKIQGLYNIEWKNQKPINWYEAIADLIPTLKLTTLTNWQKESIINYHKGAGAVHTTLLKWMGDFVNQRSGSRKKDGIPNNTIRFAHQPMFTIKAMSGKVRVSPKQATIVIDGQPYEANTQCLARWQTIPDWYQFSGDLKLDTKMIGNAVPPLMMQKIIEAVLN
jgi:DNA (cytosine-5)-methyltransferase 1